MEHSFEFLALVFELRLEIHDYLCYATTSGRVLIKGLEHPGPAFYFERTKFECASLINTLDWLKTHIKSQRLTVKIINRKVGM